MLPGPRLPLAETLRQALWQFSNRSPLFDIATQCSLGCKPADLLVSDSYQGDGPVNGPLEALHRDDTRTAHSESVALRAGADEHGGEARTGRPAGAWHCPHLVRTLAIFAAVLLALCLTPFDRAAAQSQVVLTKTASPTTYSNVGDVITYTYVFTNNVGAPLDNLSVTDNLVAPVTCSSTTVPAGDSVNCTGTYAITAADIAAGSVTNTATAVAFQGGDPFNADPVQATVTFVPPEEEEEEEVFDPRPQTRAVIERFLHHRLTALLDDEPDRPRFIRRFPGSLWGGSANANASPIDVASSGSGGSVAFSTSLSQIRQASASKPLDDKAMTLGSAALYERPGPTAYSGIDIWTEGQFTSYDDKGGTDGNFDIVYVGADYALNNNWLVGILGQFDWADETTRADGSKAEGDGWMVGPYVSGRLDEHLFFDWRAAWGSSDNSVSPFGTYSDNFDTDRWLTTARLTGNWTSGNWRLTPSVAVKYGEESQDAYTDTLGFRITGQDVTLGRVEFGPEFAHRWLLADGTLVEPQLALYGVWNFEDSGALVVNSTFFTPDDFTGRLEGGVLVQLPRGMSFRGAAAYDGIGSSDYEAVTGKVWLNFPLN